MPAPTISTSKCSVFGAGLVSVAASDIGSIFFVSCGDGAGRGPSPGGKARSSISRPDATRQYPRLGKAKKVTGTCRGAAALAATIADWAACPARFRILRTLLPVRAGEAAFSFGGIGYGDRGVVPRISFHHGFRGCMHRGTDYAAQWKPFGVMQ